MARPYRERLDELDVFRALAHPVRRKIVNAALDRRQSFNELRQLAHRSNATVAMHLRILREAKIIAATRHGNAVHYRVNRRALRSGAHWLSSITEPSPGRTVPKGDS